MKSWSPFFLFPPLLSFSRCLRPALQCFFRKTAERHPACQNATAHFLSFSLSPPFFLCLVSTPIRKARDGKMKRFVIIVYFFLFYPFASSKESMVLRVFSPLLSLCSLPLLPNATECPYLRRKFSNVAAFPLLLSPGGQVSRSGLASRCRLFSFLGESELRVGFLFPPCLCLDSSRTSYRQQCVTELVLGRKVSFSFFFLFPSLLLSNLQRHARSAPDV